MRRSMTNATQRARFFFFNDTATTEIYTLSLHDALPISSASRTGAPGNPSARDSAATAGGASPSGSRRGGAASRPASRERKSTRLNSSHSQKSYAVFFFQKKKTTTTQTYTQREHTRHSDS